MENFLKILIVESELALSRVLNLKLIREGFACDILNSGKEVVKKVEEGKYDYVILDLLLPDIDGFRILKDLKNLKKREKDIKIIVIVYSYLNQEKDIQYAKELGVEKFFIKGETKLIDIINYIKE